MKMGTFALAALLAASAATGALADNVRLVLKGYDPVAYFTESKPVKGDPKYAYDWDEGRYYFASAKHRDMFKGDPDKYAPQFGGYCTGSMARGVRNEGDPDGWTIRDGKLYVFGATRFKAIAESDPQFIPSRLDNASKHWQEKKRGS
jgi:YHS domain-containing protein